MRDKQSVDAHVYVEDSPSNIQKLRNAGQDVVIFSNSTNVHVPDDHGGRAHTWDQAEAMIRERYYAYLDKQECARPTAPGRRPTWDKPTFG